jgi:tetratricopeptide (TPR) repeat protein
MLTAEQVAEGIRRANELQGHLTDLERADAFYDAADRVCHQKLAFDSIPFGPDGLPPPEHVAKVNPLVLRVRGWSLNDLGHFLQTLGKWDEADEAYGEALKAHDALERSGLLKPGSREYVSDVDREGWKQQQIRRAWLYVKAGRPGDAEEAYRVIVQRAIGQLEAAPRGTPAQRKDVSIAMRDLGRFLNTIGRQDESFAAYKAAIGKSDEWRVGFRSETHREYACNSHMDLAVVYQSVGKAAEANRATDEAITIQRELADSGEPMNRRWLAWHLRNQGLIRWRTGRVEDAASSRAEAVEIMATLVADPAQKDVRQLASDTSDYAHLLELTGQFVEAQAAYEKAVALRRRLAEAVVLGDHFSSATEETDYWQTREAWAHSLHALAAFHLRRGHPKQAADQCARQRTVLEEHVAHSAVNPNLANEVAWSLVCCPVPTLRDPPEAVRLAQKALFFDELRATRGTLGAAQFRAGNYPEAVASLDRAMCLADEQLGAGDQFFRAMAHWKMGHFDAARRYYDEAARQESMRRNDIGEFLSMLREEAAALLGVK